MRVERVSWGAALRCPVYRTVFAALQSASLTPTIASLVILAVCFELIIYPATIRLLSSRWDCCSGWKGMHSTVKMALSRRQANTNMSTVSTPVPQTSWIWGRPLQSSPCSGLGFGQQARQTGWRTLIIAAPSSLRTTAVHMCRLRVLVKRGTMRQRPPGRHT